MKCFCISNTVEIVSFCISRWHHWDLRYVQSSHRLKRYDEYLWSMELHNWTDSSNQINLDETPITRGLSTTVIYVNTKRTIFRAFIWSHRLIFKSKHELFHFRAAVGQSAPYVTELQDNCSSKECFKGIYASIWHSLQKRMNFTYNIREEHKYGTFVDGKWNGLVGERYLKWFRKQSKVISFYIHSFELK